MLHSLFIMIPNVTADLTIYHWLSEPQKDEAYSYRTKPNLWSCCCWKEKILPNCWQLTRIQHWLEWVLDFLHTQSLKNTGQSQIWSLRSFHEHSFQNIFALQKTFHKHDQVEYTPILLQATSLKETLSLCRSIRRNRQKSFKWATVLQDLKPLRDFYYFKTWNTKVGL